MAYTTVDKVKSMFRRIEIKADTGNEATNTVVTIEDVNDFIEEVDAEIDGKLFDYYVVPIVGPESLKIIGRISKYKVAHIIKTIMEVTDSNSDKNQDVQTNLEKKADALLDDIIPHWDNKCCEWIDPRIPLQDAQMKQTSPKAGSVFSYQSSNPVIKKGGNNW